MRPRGFPTGERPTPPRTDDPVAEAERGVSDARQRVAQAARLKAEQDWAIKTIEPMTDQQRIALYRLLDQVLNAD